METKDCKIRKGGQYIMGFGYNDEAHPLWGADDEWAKLFTETEAVRLATKYKAEVQYGNRNK